MKKLCINSILLLSVCAIAYSNIVVQWYAPTGFVKADGVTPLLDGGNNTVAMLIFSPSGAFYNTPLLPGSFTIGDEIILQGPIVIPYHPLDPYGPVPMQNLNTPYMPGFLYCRIFDEGTTSNPASVTNGLWYFQGPMVATINNPDPTSPNLVPFHTGSAGFPPPFEDTDIMNRQVVPEPATLAILALGAAVVAIRRKVRE